MVIFNQVYISDVIPKTFHDKGSYYLSVTVCVLAVGMDESRPLDITFSANSTASSDHPVVGVSIYMWGMTC